MAVQNPNLTPLAAVTATPPDSAFGGGASSFFFATPEGLDRPALEADLRDRDERAGASLSMPRWFRGPSVFADYALAGLFGEHGAAVREVTAAWVRSSGVTVRVTSSLMPTELRDAITRFLTASAELCFMEHPQQMRLRAGHVDVGVPLAPGEPVLIEVAAIDGSGPLRWAHDGPAMRRLFTAIVAVLRERPPVDPGLYELLHEIDWAWPDRFERELAAGLAEVHDTPPAVVMREALRGWLAWALGESPTAATRLVAEAIAGRAIAVPALSGLPLREALGAPAHAIDGAGRLLAHAVRGGDSDAILVPAAWVLVPDDPGREVAVTGYGRAADGTLGWRVRVGQEHYQVVLHPLRQACRIVVDRFLETNTRVSARRTIEAASGGGAPQHVLDGDTVILLEPSLCRHDEWQATSGYAGVTILASALRALTSVELKVAERDGALHLVVVHANTVAERWLPLYPMTI